MCASACQQDLRVRLTPERSVRAVRYAKARPKASAMIAVQQMGGSMKTSGLMGRADPNHCQAAFLMQQDHAALLLRACQVKQSTPEVNIEDEAQARQFMAAACHRRQAALTPLELPSADPISI